MKPKVTVYIPCRTYGRFLAQAVESVLAQSFTDWELILVDDGSVDETAQVAKQFQVRYPDRIHLLRHETPRGLQNCANQALEAAKGDYLFRLDADDFLDENAFLVLSSYLERHPEVALVYSNYFYVDENGQILGVEQRKRVGSEAKLLDLPAHGACSMIRKRVLKTIGGYSESTQAQDGYELWLKVSQRYPVANVSTPLFYYRQHEDTLSSDTNRVLLARRQIKRNLVQQQQGKVRPRMAAVVPVKNSYKHLPDIALRSFAGKPLIDYTLDAICETGLFDTVLVTTDDPRVVEYCTARHGVTARLRQKSLSSYQTLISQVLNDAVLYLERQRQFFPDIVATFSIHSPLRRPEHIQKAVDTLLLHNVDTVISIYEDYDLHFTHQAYGLEPLNRGMLKRLRLEREALYVDNGAVRVSWREVISDENLYGLRIGHIVMPRHLSFQIKSKFDLWLLEKLLSEEPETVQSR